MLAKILQDKVVLHETKPDIIYFTSPLILHSFRIWKILIRGLAYHIGLFQIIRVNFLVFFWINETFIWYLLKSFRLCWNMMWIILEGFSSLNSQLFIPAPKSITFYNFFKGLKSSQDTLTTLIPLDCHVFS
jgi:hypothetical protein